MVKALSFKGDRKVKKRKREPKDGEDVDADGSTPVTNASATNDDADDTWVVAEAASDIAGPIIFVLPTTPVSCLGCDLNGKTFSSEIENIVEGDPASAEPHDVRQVWVANRVAGTQSFTFKGHHGRYLGCDKFGVLSATKEAVSPEESFICIPVVDHPATFTIQTQREKFLTIDDDVKGLSRVSIRGDGEDIGFKTTFRIRMQARFKPRLKASKEEKARERISRKELESMVGRRLDDDQVMTLKKARREGNFHEAMLDVKVKGKQ